MVMCVYMLNCTKNRTMLIFFAFIQTVVFIHFFAAWILSFDAVAIVVLFIFVNCVCVFCYNPVVYVRVACFHFWKKNMHRQTKQQINNTFMMMIVNGVYVCNNLYSSLALECNKLLLFYQWKRKRWILKAPPQWSLHIHKHFLSSSKSVYWSLYGKSLDDKLELEQEISCNIFSLFLTQIHSNTYIQSTKIHTTEMHFWGKNWLHIWNIVHLNDSMLKWERCEY